MSLIYMCVCIRCILGGSAVFLDVSSARVLMSLIFTYTRVHMTDSSYGVATISRLLKIIGHFCRISSLL